jgi:protein-S-isoprenylcysteine O-methyltransferase Ste14
MEYFLRIFLPIYLLAVFVGVMAGRSYLVWKRTGVNPYKLGSTESAHDLVGRFFRYDSFLVIFSVAVFSAFPHAYKYLAPISWLEFPWLKAAGVALLLLSLIWVAIAQTQMGSSWRVGIDSEHKTDLVKKGLFTLSRNPIFLGMRVILFGLFLTIPNALTLVAFAVGDVLMQVQVRLEEEHMAELHGEGFADYRREVRRWI